MYFMSLAEFPLVAWRSTQGHDWKPSSRKRLKAIFFPDTFHRNSEDVTSEEGVQENVC